ncbi:MAG TPA: hypothetical protein VNO55_12610 [Polyangia bacterium]|nr:hypothetical protein [Polyangia bacterium]
MSSDPEILSLVAALRRFPGLDECLIGYEGNGQSRVLDFGTNRSSPARCVAVVIEEVDADPSTGDELAQFAGLPAGRSGTQPQPSIISNRSRVASELVGAGVSCSLTVVSAVGVAAGAAAEIPTVGASTFLIVAAWTGLATGGVQCLNGLVRVGAIFSAPDDNSLQRWDSNLSYSMGILLVDGLGIASGLGSLPFAARNLWATLSRQRGFIATGLSFNSLRAMNRLERLRTISDVFEEAAKTSEGREALVKAARAAEIGSATIQRTTGISVRHAETLRSVISDETARRIASSLRDVLGSMASVGASATPASLTGSASGSVNYIINLIDAGTPGR